MIWADRITIALTGCFVVFIAALSGGPNSHSVPIEGLVGDFLKVAMIIWIPLRLIDFAVGGPWERRRTRQLRERIARASPYGDGNE